MLSEGNFYIVNSAQSTTQTSSFVTLILYIVLSVGCSLLAAFILYGCGLKETFKKFGRKKVKKDEPAETEAPNAASSHEAAHKTSEWTEIEDGVWLHAPSLSTHTGEPMDHRNTTIPGTQVLGLKCGQGCRGVSHRRYMKSQFRYSGILMIVCVFGLPRESRQFALYYPEKMMVGMSPNMRWFKTVDEIRFPEWPKQVVYKEVSVFWCRGVAMIGNGTSCDASVQTSGYFSALIMGSFSPCLNQLYYNPNDQGWDTKSASPLLRVCGSITIKATAGKYYLMEPETIRSEVFGNKPLKVVKRGLYVGDLLVCGGVGSGGGLGIVVVGVTVFCDMGDYSRAIDNLFSLQLRTATLLGDTIKYTSTNFDNVYSTLTNHSVAITQVESQSVYTSIYNLQALAKADFQSQWDAVLVERNAYYDGQHEKNQIVSELQEVVSGKKTGLVMTAFMIQIFNEAPTLKPEITINSDLCRVEASFISNSTYVSYNITAECPEYIILKELQVEERPFYSVRNSNGTCMVQQFMAVLHDTLNSAIITSEAQFNAMKFPYMRYGGMTTLHWYSGSVIPDLGASVIDHTMSSARDICPAIMVFQGEWGAVVHCGKTCVIQSDLTSHTDEIMHFNRMSQQEILAGGTSVYITKRLSNATITVLSPKWGALLTNSVGNYMPAYGSFDMMGPSPKQQSEAEINALIIVEMREKSRLDSDMLTKRADQLKSDINQAWEDFKSSHAANTARARNIAIAALILILLLIVGGAVAVVVVICIIKRKNRVAKSLAQAPIIIKESPNAGITHEWEWINPNNYKGRVILGILKPDGLWFDAEKEHLSYLLMRPLLSFSWTRKKLALALLVVIDCEQTEDDSYTKPRPRKTNFVDSETFEEEKPNAMAGLATTNLVTEIEPIAGKRKPAKMGVLTVTVLNSRGERDRLTIVGGAAHCDSLKLSVADTQRLVNDKNPRWYNDQRHTILLSDGSKLTLNE